VVHDKFTGYSLPYSTLFCLLYGEQKIPGRLKPLHHHPGTAVQLAAQT